ncbi:MAG: hypothetical protein NWR72_14055 [Bacteroidia bacterium]|nr:hypothetical protein [Bacteroidia bacterium]
MKNFLFICLAFLSLSACKPKDVPTSTPACIEKIIKEGDKQDDVQLVTRYEYEGDFYYAVTPGCCDKFTILYSSDCEEICSPSGGFTGAGDGKCPDWVADLGEGIIVWEKE